MIGFLVSYEDLVRVIDPGNGQEYVDFYGNTFFTSSIVSLVIAMVVDSHVRKLDQKQAAQKKA